MSGWTPDRLAVAMDRTLTLTQAARKLGVSRCAVAGARWRAENPKAPRVREDYVPVERTQVSVRVDNDMLAEIDGYAARVGVAHRSGALRDLLEWGLEAATEVPE